MTTVARVSMFVCGLAAGAAGCSRTPLGLPVGGDGPEPPPGCVPEGEQPQALLSGRIRDFSADHPDFEEPFIGDDQGIVLPELDSEGLPVYAGQDGNPSTSGQAAFDQWYRDVPGVNLGAAAAVPLLLLQGGLTASDSAFFPIDGQLLGNEGREHNFHFTLELHATFHHEGGEVFHFEGDDDLWAFVDGKLALDLGGVHSSATGSFEVDGLGLELDEVHTLDLFYAERHTSGSVLRVRFEGFTLCEP
jgi:fibro-slime domain-containing protein